MNENDNIFGIITKYFEKRGHSDTQMVERSGHVSDISKEFYGFPQHISHQTNGSMMKRQSNIIYTYFQKK